MTRVRKILGAAVAVGVLSFAALKVGPTLTRALTYHPFLYAQDRWHENQLTQFVKLAGSSDVGYVVERVKYNAEQST